MIVVETAQVQVHLELVDRFALCSLWARNEMNCLVSFLTFEFLPHHHSFTHPFAHPFTHSPIQLHFDSTRLDSTHSFVIFRHPSSFISLLHNNHTLFSAFTPLFLILVSLLFSYSLCLQCNAKRQFLLPMTPDPETQLLEPITDSPSVVMLEEVEDTLSDSEDYKVDDLSHSSSNSSAPVIKGIILSPSKASSSSSAAGTPKKVKRLALISSEELRTPTIAVPTIAVAAGSLLVWGSVLYAGAHKRWVSPVLTFPIMTAACFASFTPVHDATHSSVAKGVYKKPVNNLVGYLSGVPLSLPFGVYRQLHLLHHRYTNTDKDPDVWDSRGPMVVRFIKWFFPDFFWFKSVLSGELPNARLRESALYYLGVFFMMRQFHKRGMAFVKYWLIPQRAVCLSISLSLSVWRCASSY